MRPSLTHEGADYKHLNEGVHAASRTARVARSDHMNLNARNVDGVRASYSIEPDFTIGAVLVAFFAAGAAFGGMLVLGVVRTLGFR